MSRRSCSGVFSFYLENGDLVIGVTDFEVDEFGGSDWEWRIQFDSKNAELLINSLKKELDKELSIEEMVSLKFGRYFDTIEFVKYCDDLKLDYNVKREC